jgi:hypothetical protein
VEKRQKIGDRLTDRRINRWTDGRKEIIYSTEHFFFQKYTLKKVFVHWDSAAIINFHGLQHF